MDTLNVGTKEVMSVTLADRLGNISTLNGINVEQKILTEDELVTKQNWTTVFATSGMRVDFIVDTTLGGLWDEGTYKAYLRVNISPELPILGPFLFGVS